jgi:membrane-bound metal-dependent hydrolase YbcI (DUF457 family)
MIDRLIGYLVLEVINDAITLFGFSPVAALYMSVTRKALLALLFPFDRVCFSMASISSLWVCNSQPQA